MHSEMTEKQLVTDRSEREIIKPGSVTKRGQDLV